MSTATTAPATITEHEAAEIEEAKATGRVPVVADTAVAFVKRLT
jgi:hypothetical protein